MSLVALISNEEDGGHSTVSEEFFTLSKRLKEWISNEWIASVRQGLNLSLLLVLASFDGGLFTLLELRSRQLLRLSMTTHFIQLPYKFGVLEVEEILVGALGI